MVMQFVVVPLATATADLQSTKSQSRVGPGPSQNFFVEPSAFSIRRTATSSFAGCDGRVRAFTGTTRFAMLWSVVANSASHTVPTTVSTLFWRSFCSSVWNRVPALSPTHVGFGPPFTQPAGHVPATKPPDPFD